MAIQAKHFLNKRPLPIGLGLLILAFWAIRFFSNSPPKITSQGPLLVQDRQTITIHGTNFGSQAGEGKVWLNKRALPADYLLEWQDTRISFIFPAEESSVILIVENQAGKSNRLLVIDQKSYPEPLAAKKLSPNH